MIKESKEKREKKGGGGNSTNASEGGATKVDPPTNDTNAILVKEETLVTNGDVITATCDKSPSHNGPNNSGTSTNIGASSASSVGPNVNTNNGNSLTSNGPTSASSANGAINSVNSCSVGVPVGVVDVKPTLCTSNSNNTSNSSNMVNANGALPQTNAMDNFLAEATQDIKPSVGDLGPDSSGGMCGQLLGSIKMEDTGLGPGPDFSTLSDPCQGNPMTMGMSNSMGPMGGPMSGPMGSNAIGADGMQSLPTGLPKQPNTMEAQYMQQQSQIFVFCTALANKAAEAVLQGQFQTIIAFHCSQPGTKKILEKHPLKMNQFNRPTHWLNNVQMKPKPGPVTFMKGMGGPFGGPGTGPGPGPGPGMSANMGGGPMIGGPGMGAGSMGGDFGMGPNAMGGWNQGNETLGPISNMSPMPGGMGGPGMMGARMPVPGGQNMGPQMGNNQSGMGPGPMMQCCPGGNHPPGLVPCGPSSGPGGPVPCSSAGPMGLVGPAGGPCSNKGSGNGMEGSMVSGSIMTSVPGDSPMMVGPPVSSGQMLGNGGGPGRQGNGPMVSMMSNTGNINMPPGVKIPDENLTPQQRQHREEQLATIRKMQQILFPESTPDGAVGPGTSPCPPGSGPPSSQPGMMSMQGPGGPNQSGMMMMPGPQPGMMVQCQNGPNGPMMMQSGPGTPGGPMMGPKQLMMGGSGMVGGPGMMGPGPNAPLAAQMEWQKLQAQYMEEQKRKRPGGPMMNMGMCPMNSVGMPGQMNTGPMSSGPMGNVMSPMMGSMGQMGPMGPMGPMMNSSGSGSGPSPGPAGPRLPQGASGNMRMQGPPPPYHQTQRSSSVPGTMTSPGTGPGSPNSTTGLSLPSPRAASGLNSPADTNRGFNQRISNSGPAGPGSVPGPSPSNILNTPLDSPNPNASAPRSMNPSNPGTPLAGPGPPHVSPNMNNPSVGPMSGQNNMNTMSSLMSTGPSQPDGVFGRQLQTFAQQKQQNKSEPNLMPVPSPQQIQYLNSFEAQELTIQKQPNTSLRDTDILSPSLPSASLESGLPTSCSDSQSTQGHRISGPNTPLTPSSTADNGLPPRYPGNNSSSGNNTSGTGPQTPHTPNPSNPFTVPSPSPAGNQPCQNTTQNNAMVGPNTPLSSMEKSRSFPGPSPQGSMPIQNQGPRTPVSCMENNMPRTPSVMDMMPGTRYPGSSPQMPGGPASVGTPSFNQNSSGSMMTGQGPASYPTGPSLTGPGQNLKMPSSPFPDLSSPRMNNSSMGLSDMGGGCNFPGTPSDNIPLNPGGTPNNMGPSPVSGPGKMAPFDPITSMAQMSQQLTSQVGPGPQLSSSPPPSMMGPNGAGSAMGAGPMGPNMGPAMPNTMVNFNTSMHSMQGIQQMGDNTMIGPGTGGPPGPGPQTVNNTYVNATMNIQQMNIQSMHGGSYSPMVGIPGPGGQMMPMDPSKGGMPHNNMVMGVPPRGSSPGGPFPSMMQGPGPNGPMGGPGMMGVQRMMTGPTGPGPMGRAPGPGGAPGNSPFNGANVQVKASAPNTIQYLPARPQTTVPSPRGPPSLEFLQRFTGPLSNMDNKGGHNMPFFPNNGPGNGGPAGQMNTMSMNMGGPNGPMGGPMGQPMSGPGGSMASGMGGPMGNMNMGMGGPIGGPMNGPISGGMGGPNGSVGNPMMNPMGGPMTGMNGPMVGPGGVMSPGNNMSGMNGPSGPGMGPMGGGMPMMSMNSGPMGPQGMGMGGIRQPGPGTMMRPQQMGPMYPGPSGPGNPMGNDGMYMSGPGGNPNMGMGGPMGGNGPGNPMMMGGGPNPSMFNPSTKSSPMGSGPGPSGDPSMPLTPGMGGQNQGPSGGPGFKASPFMGPTTADPNYAQQFHNFQQQLYATNTRSQINNQAMGATNQPFFGHK